MKKTLIAAGILLTTANVFADSPSYDFVQISAQASDYADIAAFDLVGYELRASKTLGNNIFTEVTYASGKDSNLGLEFTADIWKVTLGYIHNLSEKVTLDYQIGGGNIELGLQDNTGKLTDDADYTSLESNIRYQFSAKLEGYSGLEFQHWNAGSDQKAYRLGLKYDHGKVNSGIEYTKFSDSQSLSLYVRYEF